MTNAFGNCLPSKRTSGGGAVPEFPALRVPAAITASTSPTGGASWDSPPELQTGDRILLLVSAGPGSPSISASGGFTEFSTPLTTLQGVTASWFYFDSPDGAPLSEAFSFPDDNSWTVAAFVIEAGSFDTGEPPDVQGGLDEGPDPFPFPLDWAWDGNTFAICSTSMEAGTPVTGYPLTDDNAYTESSGGVADVGAAICSELVAGGDITPTAFTWASSNDSAVFTVGIKGVF